MKIIRIVSELDFGGVERRLFLTSKAFVNDVEHDLTILVLGKKGKISKEIQNIGIEVIGFSKNSKIPNFLLIFLIFRKLKSISPDVVHCSGSEANFHGLLASWMAGVPHRIGEEIGYPAHDRKWKIIFFFVYLVAHDLVAISNAVKDKLIALGEVPANKIRVIYNPVELKTGLLLAKNKSSKGNDFIFGITCRLTPIKNLSTLIKSFSVLRPTDKHQSLQLWIIGEGPELESLKYLVAKKGLIGKVIFFGYQENVVPFLCKMDAFVLPSFSEGFSLSLVEAMLCSLPVIATKVGGPGEIITTQTGFLVDPYDSVDLIKNMQFVLDLTEEERRLIGKNAKAVAEKKFTLKKYKNELLKLYREKIE
ncbi:glycosyltransferase [Cyclobacterium sp.]|uniref:glycosyltransferase n=1 Tax=Cyclobacterium sp. TaxID=1966343 RepID=UPI0019883338|nr:glycosyltransferase [Cyclobacterium sp.]MBD3627857.1 glycosyltransferase [Cyclobacterium sp.]